MKIKNSFVTLTSIFLLASCGHQHTDENKDHLCDECKMILSEHKDENNNHFCDYCGDLLTGCFDEDFDGKCDICGKDIEPFVPYAAWPEKEIQDEVIVVSGSSVKIPAYEKADDIEINTDNEVEGGYFSIYCYTLNTNSENEYKEILLEAGWEVSDEKDTLGFFDAYDPNYEVNVNFGYFSKFSDLEICVGFCYKTRWPEKDIADALQIVQPGTKTVVPEFEAYTVIATYNSFVNAVAINAIGFDDSIIEDYKSILQSNKWNVFYNKTSSEWNAISSDEDIELHFYTDADNYFNVDVFAYAAPVEGWPYEEIEEAIEYMEADGEVPPFKGENTGFKVDWNFPIAIFIYCEASKQEEGRDSYNQSLIDSGYIYVGDMYGDPMYAKPGTTLAMRALIMYDVLQIELFKLDAPAAQL